MSETHDRPATRRGFLKTSAAATAGAAVLGDLAARAYASSEDLIKVALIGCGGRGRGAAVQALRTEGNVKLVAVADAFKDNAESGLQAITKEMEDQPERLDVKPDAVFGGFDAYQKVLGMPDVKLVILATPPGFRPLHFEAAIRAGKHVFMEKPVAVAAPGVRQVLAAGELAKEKNLAVGVGLQRHHQLGYIETIKRLQDGEIGDIHTARAYWNMGELWLRARKPEQTELEWQMRNWYYFNWLCGDHINEQHIHNLDVINWVKGQYPVRAIGMGGRQVRTSKDFGEIFDHHFVEFEYADGSRMFSQCRQIPGCWNSVSEHVQGTKGRSDISANEIRSGDATWRFKPTTKPKDPYQQEHDDLFASIRAGKPLNEAENGALSTMTSILGRMATYSGKEIFWKDAIASELKLANLNFSSMQDEAPVKPLPDGSYAIPVPGVTKVL